MMGAGYIADKFVHIYAGIPIAEDQFPETNAIFLKPVEGQQYLLDICDDKIIPCLIYALPVPHVWESKPGLTLVSDAAQLMLPFAGAGTNMAVWDGKELALATVNAIKTGQPLAEAVADFEQKMYKMTCPMAEVSTSSLKLITSDATVPQIVEVWAKHKTWKE
ncbi:hypothetical protein BG000_004268 [Podila horticola]|nr:hypothetical protein BG000_004268 [Podila horticola]